MIVVDTNVIAYSLITGDKTGLAQEVQKKDPNWRVPALWRHEFLNVLATSTRAEVIDLPQAREIWRQAVDMLIPAERAVDMLAALRLAAESGISAYDAQYISLACSLEVPCVTEDGRLLQAFSETAVSMETFCTRKSEDGASIPQDS